MRKWTIGIFAGALLLAAGTLTFSGCISVDHEGRDVTYYDYDYYPDWDLYYYPAEHVYYWRDGDTWVSGRELPDRYSLHEHRYEHLRLHSRHPWEENRVRHGGENLLNH
jgi:hypothetical protein